MKKKNLLFPILIIILLLIGCIIIGNVFSNQLLLPGRSSFSEYFEKYNMDLYYDASEYEICEKTAFEVESEDGYIIHGEFLTPTYYGEKQPSTDKILYFLHGYGSNRAQGIWFLKEYFDLGYSVVLYDHVGAGDSGGEYSTMGVNESRDLQLVREYIESTYGQPKVTALHGISMGASTAMYYGEIYGNVDYIVADCGYSNMRDEVIYQFKQQFDYPNFPFINLANIGLKLKAGYTLDDVNCLQSVASVGYKDIKLLIIHGDEDNFTPVQMAYDLDNVAVGEHQLEIFKNAAHAQSYQSNPTAYSNLLNSFLK